MKTKKAKRPKLVFGNHTCLYEWIRRISISDDPDNDPDVRVKTVEASGDVVTKWERDSGSSYSYVRMHPSSGDVRKIESLGRIIRCYDLFKLSKFIGSKDKPFWLINYKGSDSMTGRCRSELFRILVDGQNVFGRGAEGTDQFAFVPDQLMDVMPSDIHNNWPAYVESFRERVAEIGGWTGSWTAANSGLALRCVVDEYVQLGTYVGQQVSASDLDNWVTDAKMNIKAREVLKKLKEK
jgi:hypothetical protein